jgi:hypothetical protein
VKGSAGVMALVLAQTMAGTAVLLWWTPLWHEVKHGFFKLTGAILLVLAVAGWWSAKAARIEGDASGQWSVRLALATAAVIFVYVVLLFVKRETAGRGVGFLSVALSIATMVAMAQAGRQSIALGLFQLAAGAAFLGSVTAGLLLGHWYLTDRGLPRGPINRFTDVMLAAVVVEAVAVISGGFSGTESSRDLNPLLTSGALAPWIALGMVGTTGLVAVFTRLTLKGTRASAVQSATGFYYLAVVTAFTAELAVKIRFLPA